MNYTTKELALIAIDSLDGLEYKHEFALVNALNDPAQLFTEKEKARDYLNETIGENKTKTVLLSLTEDYAKSVVAELDKKKITAVTVFSDSYPMRLREIDTPPLVLYCNGDISLLQSDKTLAAVGSRKTLPYAEKFTKELCSEVAKAGVTIITGSAVGADKCAMLAAIENGGKAISVIAGGVDNVYPECNKSLLERVAENGLVVSEQPPHVEPKYWMFPARNRIIAGLSDVVFIASGTKTSGARHTADFALDGGKDVYAIPYSVGIASGELCNGLIKSGAYLCDSVDDVLYALGVERKQSSAIDDLTEEEKELYLAIKNGAEDMTVYCKDKDIKFFEIAPLLSSLEIQGYIVKNVGNKYKPVK